MIDQFDISSAVAVLGLLALGGGLVEARAYRARRREGELADAYRLLQIHYDAMDILDDDDTPSVMLELALDWNKIIHDRDSPALIAENASLLAETSRPIRHRPTSALSEALVETNKRRPDLVEAFIRCLLSGIEAFMLRHPDCRPALGHLVLDLASAPAEQSMRVVRLASKRAAPGKLAHGW